MTWSWLRTAVVVQLLVPVVTFGAQLEQAMTDKHPVVPIDAVWPQAAYVGGSAVVANPGYVQAPPQAPVDPTGERSGLYVRPLD
jgi:hypothetical protein